MPSRFSRILVPAAMLVLGGGAEPMRGQPTGGQVVAGSASLASSAEGLTVTQTSARAIITWQGFSLSAGTLARFIQPDAASATLNRVVSGLPSELDGAIQANGRVYLINPNGIIVGAGARIDTAGFIASTLDVTNEEFLEGGDLHFAGSSTAAVQNLGTINALGGDVFLIARQVENSGTIAATGGVAGLAAGSEVLLTTGGDERVFVQAASLPGTVVNSGVISGAAAELKAAGGNSYALAINNTGWVRATGSDQRGGEIWLVGSGDGTVANAGTLDASSGSGKGGKVVVSGAQVLLDAGSKVDASGATGGGVVEVGSGDAVVMQPGAQIDVSATTSGNGGVATLLSQNFTAFRGDIQAGGGAAGGDGGNVETSSGGTLEAVGTVEAAAAHGAAGAWTLDPVNVTIAATGASGSSFANPFTPTSDSVILASSVTGALNGGSNVTISTGSTGSSTGDITVNAPLSWTSNQTLTLAAKNNVEINANLTATGNTAGLVLTPNANGGVAGVYSLNDRSVITLSGLTPSLSIAGHAYTVLSQVGVAGDTSATTLQGMLGNLAGYYALGVNVDASATSGWNAGKGFTPVGDATTAFTGTFDGLGHTISGLTIALPPTVFRTGLFGQIDALGVVRNVGLVGGSMTGFSDIGAVAGDNYGTISNCFSSVPVTSGNGYVGGLVGWNYGSILDSYTTGTVTATNVVHGNEFVGGISALNYGIINGCYATGNVVTSVVNGGIIGGLVGDNFTGGSILNSYATGSVTGGTTGGHDVGGLVGGTLGSITNSYSTGPVIATGTNIGGFSGSVAGAGSITSSYWATDTSGQSVGIGSGTAASLTGLTTAQMKQVGGFSGFNISDVGGTGAVWRIYDGNSMPLLTWFLQPLTITANDDSKTYNGVAYVGTNGATYSIATPGPTLLGSLSYGGSAAGAVNAGSYSIAPGGYYSIQLGYDVIDVSGALTITKAPLTLQGTRVYDGTTVYPGSDLTAVGVNGQTFSMTGTGNLSNLGSKNVQTGVSLASFTGLALGTSSNGGIASNYQPLNFAVTLSQVDITPASLTLTGAKVYDGNTLFPGADLTATGVNGETFTVGGTGDTSNLASRNVNSGEGLLSATGLVLGSSGNGGLASNYRPLSQALSKVDVTPANLVLTGTRLYDGTTVFAGSNLTATGVNGETFAVAGAGATGDLSTKNVQTNQALGSVSGLAVGTSTNGGLAGNYHVLSTVGSVVSVTPANLALTGTRVYDGTTIFAGSSLTAVGVNGESFTVTGTGANGDLSTKNVQASQTLASVNGLSLGSGSNGGVASNYQALGTTNSSVSVTPANLTLSGTMVYNGTTDFAGTNLTATGVAGETFSVAGSGATGNLTTKNVQSNQLLASVGGLALGTSGNGGLAGNYAVLGTAGSSVSVTPASLALTGTKVYDGNTVFAGGNLTAGGVNGETFTVTGAGDTSNLSSKNVSGGEGLATATGLALGSSSNGGLASNYQLLSIANSHVTVTPANLVLTGTRVYDGTTIFAGSLATATGVNGETFTVTGAGASGDLSTKNVQTNQSLATVAGLSLGTSGNGGLAGNYVPLAATGSSVSVTPAPLTLSGTMVYNGTTDFAGAHLTATGVAGETFSVSGAGAAGNLSIKDVQTNQSLASLTGLAVGSSGNGGLAGNYTALSTVNSSVSVTPAPLTIAADNQSRAPNSANPALTVSYTGLVPGDTSAVVSGLSVTTPAVVSSPSGPYPITPAGASASDYAITFVPGTLTIGDVILTIAANNQSKTYGAPLPGFTASESGFILGDTSASVTGLQFSTVATAGSNVGSYAITPFGATAPGYYTIDYVTGTLTINPAALVITAGSFSRLYGAANPGFGVTYAGFVNGDSSSAVSGLAIGSAASASSSVGSYPIVPAGATAANYTINYIPGSLTINPAPLTITANNASRSYNAANPPFTASYAGLVNGDTAAVVTGLALTTPATPASLAGIYPITPSGANALNYAISYVPGHLSIDEDLLTITANSQSVTYGSSLSPFSAGYVGFVNGDTAAVVTGLQYSTSAHVGSNVGVYTVTPFGASAPGYYTLDYVAGTVTINPAALTIGATGQSRLYGSANAPFGATYAGFVNGDTASIVTGLSLSSTAGTGSAVGTYSIVPSGANAPNYTIGYVPGTLVINPAPLTITANNGTRLYGAANPAFTASYAGFVAGDTSSVVSGLALNTPAVVSSNVGGYAITPSAAIAANYVVTYIPGTLTVDPVLLTVAAGNASRQFGAANPTFTDTITGFVNGDTSAVVTGLALTTAATVDSPAGIYAITPAGAHATNYAFLYVPGALTVAVPTVTVIGTSPTPVLTIGQQPILTSDLAVIIVDNHVSLVPVSPTGGVLVSTASPSMSLDAQLSTSLGETANPPAAPGASAPALPSNLVGIASNAATNFGAFEPAAASGGRGGSPSDQPDLYRESSLKAAGFNVVYHEPLATAQRQDADNTALGSSYREFSDSDNPQVTVVRSKVERKSTDAARGETSSATP